MWEIESEAAKIQEKVQKVPAVQALKYGVAPTGFITVVPAQPLAAGKTYRVTSSVKVEGKQAVVGAGGEFTPTAP